MKRTKVAYLLGKSSTELLACDDKDSKGSGKWFTDDPIMAEEHGADQASEKAAKEGLEVFLWQVTYDTKQKMITGEELTSMGS
jgi:hypothetical protein